MKPVAVLNKAFSKEELKNILEYLKEKHSSLYLCALLMYGCFLRPHREVRCLKPRHVSADCGAITLSGNENKGKRIRIVRVPPYIQSSLQQRIAIVPDSNYYLITGTKECYNPDYLKMAWGRFKQDMMEKGVLRVGQSLYSFRHAGAVNLYQKTKDPYKVQQAMGHSSLIVTLSYLRSLGIVTNLPNDYPEL